MLFAFRKDGQANRSEREHECFLPFLHFYRRPYNEISYCTKMHHLLGGLISIVCEKFKQKPVQQPSVRRGEVQAEVGAAAVSVPARRTPPPPAAAVPLPPPSAAEVLMNPIQSNQRGIFSIQHA
jgi:hypothetical protein